MFSLIFDLLVHLQKCLVGCFKVEFCSMINLNALDLVVLIIHLLLLVDRTHGKQSFCKLVWAARLKH